jgi:two-component system, sensor histidine kinase FlrB
MAYTKSYNEPIVTHAYAKSMNAQPAVEERKVLDDALAQSSDISERLAQALSSNMNITPIKFGNIAEESVSNNGSSNLEQDNHPFLNHGHLSNNDDESSQLQHLISILPCGIIIVDNRGMIKQCNTAASQLMQCNLLHQQWRDVVDQVFQPQADDGHEVSLASGRKVRVDTRALGYQPGQLIILTDLTETRRLQQQVAQNERLVYLGRMMASLAHQIRTPLSAVTLQAANLQSPNLTLGLAKRFSQKIQKGLGLIERQVKDMLLFVRDGKSSKVALSWQSVHQTVDDFMKTLIAKRNISIVGNHPKNLIQLLGQQDDLIGALQNIAENAIQAIPSDQQGVIEFSSSVKKQFVEIIIADNGYGMSDEQKSKIFEPFYTSKATGTGLGLAICRTIIYQHGGEIDVTSQMGKGTRFEIKLPIYIHAVDSQKTKLTKQQNKPQQHFAVGGSK